MNSSGVLTPTLSLPIRPPGLVSHRYRCTVYFGTQADGKMYAITSSFGLRKGGWPKFKHENQSTAYMGAYDDDYGRGGDGTKPPIDIEDPNEEDDYDKEGPGIDPDKPSQPPSDKKLSSL